MKPFFVNFISSSAYCTNPNEDLSNVMVSRSQTRLPSETSVEYNCSKLGQAINGSITTESWTATCQANGQWDELLPCTGMGDVFNNKKVKSYSFYKKPRMCLLNSSESHTSEIIFLIQLQHKLN